mmetsp:Transcript_12515/g.39748  ORF Transcript_12515/g.39748 Transcript_12515/m.39748 type:complete len:231 (+) Transcript_12515:1541-2233(+)
MSSSSSSVASAAARSGRSVRSAVVLLVTPNSVFAKNPDRHAQTSSGSSSARRSKTTPHACPHARPNSRMPSHPRGGSEVGVKYCFFFVCALASWATNIVQCSFRTVLTSAPRASADSPAGVSAHSSAIARSHDSRSRSSSSSPHEPSSAASSSLTHTSLDAVSRRFPPPPGICDASLSVSLSPSSRSSRRLRSSIVGVEYRDPSFCRDPANCAAASTTTPDPVSCRSKLR